MSEIENDNPPAHLTPGGPKNQYFLISPKDGVLCAITENKGLIILALEETLETWEDETDLNEMSQGTMPMVKFLLLEIIKLREQLSTSSPEKPIQ